MFCVRTHSELQRSQAPGNSAYFRNPPLLSGQAGYCSCLSGLWTGPSIQWGPEVVISVHSNTSWAQECVSAKNDWI